MIKFFVRHTEFVLGIQNDTLKRNKDLRYRFESPFYNYDSWDNVPARVIAKGFEGLSSVIVPKGHIW